MLELFVINDAPLGEINEEHAPRLETTFAKDVFRREGQDTYFGRKYDPPILGLPVSSGTESIAVENGADYVSITEADRRRTVPRFHQGRVVAVEVSSTLLHGRRSFPSFGNQHENAVGQRAA